MFIFNFTSKGSLWREEAEDKYCTNHDASNDVTNQLQCQQRCESKSNCIGISYSHKVGNTQHCYVCYDNTFASAANDFGFYRRSGITTFQKVLNKDIFISI